MLPCYFDIVVASHIDVLWAPNLWRASRICVRAITIIVLTHVYCSCSERDVGCIPSVAILAQLLLSLGSRLRCPLYCRHASGWRSFLLPALPHLGAWTDASESYRPLTVSGLWSPSMVSFRDFCKATEFQKTCR